MNLDLPLLSPGRSRHDDVLNACDRRQIGHNHVARRRGCTAKDQPDNKDDRDQRGEPEAAEPRRAAPPHQGATVGEHPAGRPGPEDMGGLLASQTPGSW